MRHHHISSLTKHERLELLSAGNSASGPYKHYIIIYLYKPYIRYIKSAQPYLIVPQDIATTRMWM